MARKAIALRWMDSRLPSLSQWTWLIPLYHSFTSVKNRGCLNKFGKVWGTWCNTPHTLYSAQSFSHVVSRLDAEGEFLLALTCNLYLEYLYCKYAFAPLPCMYTLNDGLLSFVLMINCFVFPYLFM